MSLRQTWSVQTCDCKSYLEGVSLPDYHRVVEIWCKCERDLRGTQCTLLRIAQIQHRESPLWSTISEQLESHLMKISTLVSPADSREASVHLLANPSLTHFNRADLPSYCRSDEESTLIVGEDSDTTLRLMEHFKLQFTILMLVQT